MPTLLAERLRNRVTRTERSLCSECHRTRVNEIALRARDRDIRNVIFARVHAYVPRF